jgi:adenylylsulfate kinase
LDGDVLREVYGGYDGHSRAARLAVAYRNARLCRLLSNQGLTVIIATISMFHEIHAFNREQLAGYVEVFIDVPLSVLEQRDQKQLYSRGATGEAQHVYGVDLQPELPLAPTLRLFNDGSRSIQALADDCVAFLSGHSAHGSPA